jgi:predicted secreted protein
MAQYSGRELLIKRGDGAGPEVFTALCGLDARSFTVNNNLVDVSVPDCITPGGKVWQSMAYGIQSLAFTGSGIFSNDAQNVSLFADVFNQTARNYQVIVPGIGTFQGAFHVENIGFSGAKEGNEEYELSFRSTGVVTFTPA